MIPDISVVAASAVVLLSGVLPLIFQSRVIASHHTPGSSALVEVDVSIGESLDDTFHHLSGHAHCSRRISFA